MNLTQGHRLKRGPFRFQSAGDDVEVFREYKGRRGGEVEFRIFKAYRRHFERYREWIDHFVPADEDPRLFPFIYPTMIPAIDSPPNLEATKKRCKAIGLKFVGPQKLRRTRVNWLLRRTRDPDLTADEAQHSKQTLFKVYEEPNHHLAAREITTFFKLTDPSITPPGPGACVDLHRRPESVPGKPPEAPAPDCISPAGCLFCVFHRDVDSEDYVWSLASYRYLKTIELSFYKPPSRNAPEHPAAAVINRVTAKLEHLRQSSEIRALWVREAEDRVSEGVYHPHWDGFIQLMEISR